MADEPKKGALMSPGVDPIHAQESSPQVPGFLKKWFVAIRPFALPASITPVVFGTSLAATSGNASFRPLLFLAALFSIAVMHSGANLLNDALDYSSGLDCNVTPGSGAVVRRWVSVRRAFWVAWLFLGGGMIIGAWIVWQVGWPILWIGLVGVLIGVVYTWGPFELKFHALGDLAVFLNFGVLGALGAWTVQTGAVSWVPVVWAIPMSLLVSAILHANNWRDIDTDREGGIATVANLLGDRKSAPYYAFLVLSPFLLIVALLFLTRVEGFGPAMPWTFLIVFAALPKAFGLIEVGQNRARESAGEGFSALDASTGQLNLMFGLLCTAALFLKELIELWLRLR